LQKIKLHKKPKYGTAGYEDPKPLEKWNIYPHLLNSAAVPPTLGAEVNNKHKICRKEITQN